MNNIVENINWGEQDINNICAIKNEIFVENINFSSSSNLFVEDSNKIHQPLGHVESHLKTIDWWKTCGLNLNNVKNYPEVFG